jgi:hypothetical protein
MLDSDEKIQDLTNTDPRPRNSARINKLDNKYQDKQHRDKQSTPRQSAERNNRYSNNRNGRKDKWADNLEWKIIEGAECPGCKRSNHNVYSTGCPAFAQFAICKDFYETCSQQDLAKVKANFIEYQRSRRKLMNERKRNGRAAIRKFESKGVYDEEDMAKVKLTFFECYKDDFQEEQFLEINPFEDATEDQQEDDEVIEIDV